MHETILKLAQAISGSTDAEQTLLDLLCTAAEKEWSGRLRDGVLAENCEESYTCAAAFTAVARLIGSRSGKNSVSSFTAGSVSVSSLSGKETTAAAAALQSQAEQIMAPYVEEADFSFRGVRA